MIDVESLLALLEESKRDHYHCDDSWYCCGKCVHPDHSDHDADWPATHHEGRIAGVCNCGADAWNTRVDVAITQAGGRLTAKPSKVPAKTYPCRVCGIVTGYVYCTDDCEDLVTGVQRSKADIRAVLVRLTREQRLRLRVLRTETQLRAAKR